LIFAIFELALAADADIDIFAISFSLIRHIAAAISPDISPLSIARLTLIIAAFFREYCSFHIFARYAIFFHLQRLSLAAAIFDFISPLA
jgi:hypothetical protein